MSNSHPELDLNRLREIGWSLWDPIGLDGGTGIWKEESFADEYDSYLIKAAGMLKRDEGQDIVVRYLFHIESDRMCLGPKAINREIRQRLSRVVQAIADDPGIWIENQS
ncbi:hypothetical protein [Roseovarius pacificus]|uniref:hypothetical protein n=1 Tax=Roseovarius pacificus TaxID=337701 RepID=UPI004039F45D